MFPDYSWLTTSPFVDICIWGQITPDANTLEGCWPESNSAESETRSCGDKADYKPGTESHHKPTTEKCQQFPGLHWECCQQVEGGDPGDSSPLLITKEITSGVLWPLCAPDFEKDSDGSLRAGQYETTKMIKSLGLLSYGQSLREMVLSTLEKRMFREGLINMYKYLMGHIWGIQRQFLLSSTYDTARDDGHKLKSTTFQLNKRKLSFCCLWGWSSARIFWPEMLWSLCALNHPWNWENLTEHSDRQPVLDPAWVGQGME